MSDRDRRAPLASLAVPTFEAVAQLASVCGSLALGLTTDFAIVTMVIGFNSEVELSRSHTLMESGTWCGFRFRKVPE
jgi:hypothetical protein